MPWFWSDDLANALITLGKIDAETALSMSATPVAYRRDSESAEDVANELAEAGEIPLAA